ncbi:hypothetical protein NOCARDAX2BIS_80004 [Nocardioides sp. AX2bis]|nr:hypothetical protein NOCARDAX2BIS_80004 [Nocardioides sp. AX2bis]
MVQSLKAAVVLDWSVSFWSASF